MTQEEDREAFLHWWVQEGFEHLMNIEKEVDNAKVKKYKSLFEDAWLNGAYVAEERCNEANK